MLNKPVFLLSLASGILLSLPWLFPNLGWSLFFAFVPLLLAEDRFFRPDVLPNTLLFYAAFIAFLVWNVLSTWWIGYVSITGMLIIAMFNALIMASVWLGASVVRRQHGPLSGFFSLVIFWLSFEFLQHHWAIQWPWLVLGNGLANSVKMIQWYEFTGVLGGSLWILFSNILIFLFVKYLFEKSFLNVFNLTAYVLILLGVPFLLSIHLYSGYTEKGTLINVAVLQPNINPYTEKFSGMSPDLQIRKLVSLAESAVSDSTDLIITPETAFPPMWEDSIQTDRKVVPSISGIIRKFANVSLLAGAMTKRKFNSGETVSETARRSTDRSFSYDIFNSSLLFDRTEKIQIAHKSILVSGVEKMPFQKYFSFMDQFTLNLGGTNGSLASASVPSILTSVNGVKIGPVICFESAFGAHSADLVKSGAQVLVVITNDGWWSDSPGIWQHFGYSRIRAIETRRSIACSANTGISGFINQRGDVIKKSSVNSSVALSSKIGLSDEISFYAKNGDIIGRISFLLSGLIAAYLLLKNWIWKGKR
ncbi:MAG: apolipoprotein N-acyltransferase [Bacteroidia bacterium]